MILVQFNSIYNLQVKLILINGNFPINIQMNSMIYSLQHNLVTLTAVV